MDDRRRTTDKKERRRYAESEIFHERAQRKSVKAL
jgi:hypothetical protein